MAFIKLNQRLELTDGDGRKNLKVDDDDVTEQPHWVVFRYEDHTYKVPRDLVAFVRYAEDIEEEEDLEDETEILIG